MGEVSAWCTSISRSSSDESADGPASRSMLEVSTAKPVIAQLSLATKLITGELSTYYRSLQEEASRKTIVEAGTGFLGNTIGQQR